jgi:ankyrin repeat protein
VDLAVTAGRSQALGLLLAFARPEQRVDLQRRALQMALEKDRLSVLRALLRTGAPTDSRDRQGRPLLIQAIRRGNPEAVAALLEAGASLLQGDPQGQSPLHWAVIDQKEDLVLLLLSAGASAETRNGQGLTPLDLARRSGWARGEEILAGPLPAEDAAAGS